MLSPASTKWMLLGVWPLARGEALHRAALAAAHEGRLTLAARLFVRAGVAYRQELHLLPLARLRVHELMTIPTAADAETSRVEIERRLERLDEIESLEPPFALIPAAALLEAWLAAGEAAPDAAGLMRAA
jgi:hypothetical protein